MIAVDLCPECEVPWLFAEGQAWLDNGDIVQSVNQNARVAFMECENLDPLFKNIGEIIGVSIEHLMIDIATKGNKIYLSRIIPKEVTKMVRSKRLEVMPFIEHITTLAQVSGYAKYELLDFRYQHDPNDYSKHRIVEPFSLPLAIGGYAGAISAIAGGTVAVTYEEVSPHEYIFVARGAEHPENHGGKLYLQEYHHREGDIALERCATCGCPKAYADYRWYPERGMIRHRQSGRRMALLGPGLLDPIFSALQEELGESIGGIVIEAQRRFVRTGFCPLDILESEESVREQLALRGLGNLKSIKVDAKGANLRIGNACLHLLLVGLVQGTYEMLFGVDSNVQWELSDDGGLEIVVNPRVNSNR